MNRFTDDYGTTLTGVHSPNACDDEYCVIHNPSNHPMREFKLRWREAGPFDIKPSHFERICPHGVGHPDPDALAFCERNGIVAMGVHGCDGCCEGQQKPQGGIVTQITGPHGAVEVSPNDPQTAIKKLKELGYQVFVSHKRWSIPGTAHGHVALPTANAYEIKAQGLVPLPKGGATFVTIAKVGAPEGDAVIGIARCSDLDNFDRKLGTRIALGRALKGMPC